MVKYEDEWWTVETIYYNKNGNARLRIGHIDYKGIHQWEIIFEKDAEVYEDPKWN